MFRPMTLTCLIISLFASTSNLASTLWKIEKNGNKNYLFGTMHVADEEVNRFSDQLNNIISTSAELIVEVISNEVSDQAFVEHSQMATGNLRQLLGDYLFNEVASGLKEQGVQRSVAIKLKPWAAALFLSYPKPSAKPVMDKQLQQLFIKSGRKVHALESIDEQLKIFDTLPMNEQITFLKNSLSQYDSLDSNISELKSLYIKGDLETLYQKAIQGHDGDPFSAKITNLLINQRNDIMFKRIQRYLKDPNSLIAVGALHLPGDSGLLQRLKNSGYILTRIDSEDKR